MEHQPKTNWYTDYLINETINEQVKSIIGTYARLKFNNPNHFDLVKWEADKDKWVDFKHSLPSLFLNTEQEAEALISKISNTNKQLLELELYLLSITKLNDIAFSKDVFTESEITEIEGLKTIISNYNDKHFEF